MAIGGACTLWFDRLWRWDWSACCVQHDAAYDLGLDRLAADLALFHCVRDVAGWPMATLMLGGVALGGWLFFRRKRPSKGL